MKGRSCPLSHPTTPPLQSHLPPLLINPAPPSSSSLFSLPPASLSPPSPPPPALLLLHYTKIFPRLRLAITRIQPCCSVGFHKWVSIGVRLGRSTPIRIGV
ncbi:hypothetical protein TB2_014383 [Malus domestica]